MARLIDHAGPASDLKLMATCSEIYKARFAALQRKKNKTCPKVAGFSALHIDTSDAHPLQVAVSVIENVFGYLERSLDKMPAAPVVTALSEPPRDSTVITREELWGFMVPHAETFLDSTQRNRLKERLPHLLELAQQVQDVAALRAKLAECEVDLPRGDTFVGPRALADHMVDAFEEIIKGLLSE